MKKFIEEAVTDAEFELERPLNERLFRVLFVGFAGVFATWAAGKAFDKFSGFEEDRQKAKEEVEMLEGMLEH